MPALAGFRRLESEGFFGTGPARSTITLLPVGDLPEELVQAWVSALNPPDVAERSQTTMPTPPTAATEHKRQAEQIAAADGGPFIGFPRYYAQQAAAAELWRSAALITYGQRHTIRCE